MDIEDQINKIRKKKPNLNEALIIAINIEKSLLESTFFKVFKLNVPQAQKIQTQLVEATKSHNERLIEWQSKIKKT